MEELKQQMETILKGLDAFRPGPSRANREAGLPGKRYGSSAGGNGPTHGQVTKWKRKGNEKQFTFNETLLRQQSGSWISLNPTNHRPRTAILKTAKEQLEEDMQAITDRQKLICFVDCSQYGWGAVEENLQEDIAKDKKEAKKWADAKMCMNGF